MLNAAVIGLGNIGFQFDIDPKRKTTWSHVSAYTKCGKTRLVGAVEIDDKKASLFKDHYKNIPVFKTVKDLMSNLRVDIVSVATPTATHYPLLKELLKYPLKAIFCEKPLAASVGEAEDIIKMCDDAKIVLAVNHNRRWDSHYLYVKKIIKDKRIGNIKTVNALYSGQVFNIGTHLFDTIRMLIKKDPKAMNGISFNLESNDPDVAGWIWFDGNIPCTIISTGKREDLIFEIDVIGDLGRIRILENGEKIEQFIFAESAKYSGYRELFSVPTKKISKKDRFLEAVNDIVKVVEGKKGSVNCAGIDGLYALSMSFAMFESAKRNNEER